jgi:hypothetical protein
MARTQLLQHFDTLAQLVDWAENVLIEGKLAEGDAITLSAVIARLGVADVRALGKRTMNLEQMSRSLRVFLSISGI